MAHRRLGLTVIGFSCLLALAGGLFWLGPGQSAGNNQRTPTPVRWQPPQNLGRSGRRSGNPPATVLGGSRNGCISSGSTPLTALIPASYEGLWGSNVTEPVLYVYFPYDQGDYLPVSFSLRTWRNGAEEFLLEQNWGLPAEPGLVPIALPSDLTLAPGQVYRWRFAVNCGGPDQTAMDYVEGNLTVAPVSSELAAELASATPAERLAIYFREGWWYNAVHGLMTFQQSDVGGSALMELWSELLSAEGLDDLSPIVILSEMKP